MRVLGPLVTAAPASGPRAAEWTPSQEQEGDPLWTGKTHTHQIGCIVTNLQALETVRRRYLMAVHGQQMQSPNVGDLKTGETYLTNFLSLEALVRKLNDSLTEEERKFEVDTAVVDLRNAFAHGRLLTENEFPARLWKFWGRSRRTTAVPANLAL